jgi:LmbE family N-acetylglucosaminyl deacetylase
MWFRSGLRAAKRSAAFSLEQLWSAGFLVVGLIRPRQIRPWSSPGRDRVLIVAPHPDDEAAGCAGTLLKHVASGDEVILAIATDGRQSKVNPDAHQMCRQRRSEAQQAACLLGIKRLEWIGLEEGAWRLPTLVEKLSGVVRSHPPTIIYAPSRIDFHPEHRRVAHALAVCLAGITRDAPDALRLRIYPIQVPLHDAVINLVTDVSTFHRQTDAVMDAYESQVGSLRRCNRPRRYNGKRYGIEGRAEVFWEVSASTYVALHRESPEGWPDAFRGLRDFPLTDPLAYLRGFREQRRLIAEATR